MANFNTPARLFNFNGNPPSEGLISAWNLENANDNFGANNLTNNGVVTFVAGKILNAANFVAASSQSLSIADNASLSMGAGKKLTICAWVKVADLSVTRTVCGKWNTTGNQREYALQITNAGNVFFAVSSTGAALVSVSSTGGPIVVGVWNFIVAWYDGTKINIEINANGVIFSTVFSADIFDGTANFRIGALDTPADFMDGQVDAVRIYKHDNRVLTANERSILYNLGIGRQYSSSNIVSSKEVNSEFDQFINLFNGITKDITPKIAINDSVPALSVNQSGNGPIISFKNNGVTVSEINTNGQFKSLLATGTAPITLASATTGRIDNLNVDLVDDLNADEYLQTNAYLGLCDVVFWDDVIFVGSVRWFIPQGTVLLALKAQQRATASSNAQTVITLKKESGTSLGSITINGNTQAVIVQDVSDFTFDTDRLFFEVTTYTGTIKHEQITISCVSKQSVG